MFDKGLKCKIKIERTDEVVKGGLVYRGRIAKSSQAQREISVLGKTLCLTGPAGVRKAKLQDGAMSNSISRWMRDALLSSRGCDTTKDSHLLMPILDYVLVDRWADRNNDVMPLKLPLYQPTGASWRTGFSV